MRWVGLLWLGALSGCAAQRFGAGVDVMQVTSTHFEAIGDVPAQRLELEVSRLEQLYDVFAVFFKAEAHPGQRIRLAVMREGEPAEFVDDAGGFVTRGVLEPFVITSVGDDSRFFVTNAHELVHLLSAYALPGQPRWFSEGIASLFEDAHFQSDGSIKMGTWRDVYVWTSVDDLLTWDSRPVRLADSGPLYATSRALLFYLANRDEQRLERLIEGLRARRPVAELYADLFPSDERVALLERVKAFVAEQKFSAWRTRLLRESSSSTLRRLEPWEVSLWRSQLARATGRYALSQTALVDAKTQAPKPEPAPLMAERIERGEWVEDVVPEPLVQLALAGADDRSYTEHLVAARNATTQLPLSALAFLRLARAARAVRQHDEALVAARQASSLAPWSTAAVFEESRALSGLGRCREASAAFSVAVGMLESPEASWVTKQQRDIVQSCREHP